MVVKSIVKKITLVVAGVVVLCGVTLVTFFFWAASGTLPADALNRIKTYGDVVVPVSGEQAPDTFRVMTFNVGYLSGMSNNLAVREDRAFFDANLKRLQGLLERVDADFMACQEIDFKARRSYYIDQAAAAALAGGFAYGVEAVNWDKRYVPFPYWPPSVHFGPMLSGQAVLSRFPVVSARRLVLQKPGDRPFYYNAFYLDRLLQVVQVRVAGQSLVLMNVHLEAYDRETRRAQAGFVLETLRTYKDRLPVILLGDFNCVPPDAPKKSGFSDEPGTDYRGEITIEMFRREPGLAEARPDNVTGGGSYTFPSGDPDRKLDYIFYTPGQIRCLGARVITNVSCSDHFPVVMTFSFK